MEKTAKCPTCGHIQDYDLANCQKCRNDMENPIPPTYWFRRQIAGSFDVCVLGVIIFPLFYVYQNNPPIEFFPVTIFLFETYFVILNYYFQRTIGQWIVGIKVQTEDNAEIKLKNVIIRELSFLLCFTGIGLIVNLIQGRFWDHWSKIYVVKSSNIFTSLKNMSKRVVINIRTMVKNLTLDKAVKITIIIGVIIGMLLLSYVLIVKPWISQANLTRCLDEVGRCRFQGTSFKCGLKKEYMDYCYRQYQ